MNSFFRLINFLIPPPLNNFTKFWSYHSKSLFFVNCFSANYFSNRLGHEIEVYRSNFIILFEGYSESKLSQN